ncbi:MAG: aldehyde dehydrogenase family protein [Thermoplasmatota archaeon]
MTQIAAPSKREPVVRASGKPPHYRAYVAGEWVDSSDGRTLEVRDPATERVIATVPHLTIADTERAIDAAHASRRKIRDIPAAERVEILERVREQLHAHDAELLEIVITESGKPIGPARGEVKATLERLRLTAQEARSMHGEYIPGDWVEDTKGKFAIVRRQPRGVVAAITPFNYPLFIAAAKVAPALVSGNTVVVKPSSETPLSMLHFAAACETAGLPPGTLNILTGPGADIGDTLARSDKVDMISFTGSTKVGERIASLAGMKHLALELGGKGAALVLPDANLDLTAREITRGALRFQGQRCDAIDRVLVDATIADTLAERITTLVKRDFPAGDPHDEKTAIGPLINARATKYAKELIDDATTKGAKLLAGGTLDGNYLAATVLDHVTTEMRIAWEETFAPIIPILRVTGGTEEMLQLANQSQYALDSSVFTNDLTQAWSIARRLEDGAVTLNGYPQHGVGHFPFGGNKKSGMGREGIGASIEEMTRVQTIVFNMPPMSKPFEF